MTTTAGRVRAPLLPGFGVLLHKELLEARRSKRIIIFLGIMCLAVALIPTVGYVRIVSYGIGARHTIGEDGMHTLLAGWTALVGYLGALMLIASTVDAVSRERSLGISAWIVTKPVSRMSYLAAKAVAHAIVGACTLVLAPTAVFIAMTLALFTDVSLANVGIATLILCIEMAFLAFFIVALGVPFRSVTPIAIIGLALWFLPTFVPAIASLRWTYRVLPSYLPLAAVTAAVDEMSSAVITVPAVSIDTAAALFAVAVIMFERQEL